MTYGCPSVRLQSSGGENPNRVVFSVEKDPPTVGYKVDSNFEVWGVGLRPSYRDFPGTEVLGDCPNRTSKKLLP